MVELESGSQVGSFSVMVYPSTPTAFIWILVREQSSELPQYQITSPEMESVRDPPPRVENAATIGSVCRVITLFHTGRLLIVLPRSYLEGPSRFLCKRFICYPAARIFSFY